MAGPNPPAILIDTNGDSLALVNANVANTHLTAPALNMNLTNAYPTVLPTDALQVQQRARPPIVFPATV